MRARDAARGADGAQSIARLHRLAFRYLNLAQVAVHRDVTLAVIEDHGVAIEEIVTGCSHDTGSWRGDGRAGVHWHGSTDSPLTWRGKRQAVDRLRAKIVQRRVDDLAFAPDACQLLGVG